MLAGMFMLMGPRQVREAIERATEAVTGSHIARMHSSRAREAWRTWHSLWSRLRREPLAERMLTVCMYCERVRTDTGEWLAPPVDLAEILHDQQLVQLTHGACPICLAAHLDEP
jgi:hypothetical protein